LVAQAEIQPFAIGADRRTGALNVMGFYDLPSPKAAVEEPESKIATMMIALSNLMEPNLTGRAATRTGSCRSFGLRFEIKTRTGPEASFCSRISASQSKDGARADGERSCRLPGPKAAQGLAEQAVGSKAVSRANSL
jgi:hypothetical protein